MPGVEVQLGYIRQVPQRVVFLPEGRAEVIVVGLREGRSSSDTPVLTETEVPFRGVIALERFHDTGWEPDLDWLYKKLACSCVDMREIDGGQIWFDDEGKCNGRVINPIATLLYTGTADPIVGHALLVIDPAQHGDLAEVDAQLEAIRKVADEAFFSNVARMM